MTEGGEGTPAGLDAVTSNQRVEGDVFVLLPALNEEGAIGSVIDRIPSENVRSMGYRLSVWVVDGHSTDATLEVAARKGANIFVQKGSGKGNAMREAFQHLLGPESSLEGSAASRRFVIMLDSDGTYPPERIPGFVRKLESGHDVVLGSRFLGRIETGAMNDLNRLGNRFLSALARFLYGVPVSDVCTGMWGFNSESLYRLGLVATGFDLEADVFARACQMRTRIGQVPIEYGQRVGVPKLVPLRTGISIAWRLLLNRLRGTDRPSIFKAAGDDALPGTDHEGVHPHP